MLKRFAGFVFTVAILGIGLVWSSTSSSFSWGSIISDKPLVFYSSTEQLKNLDFQVTCYEERVHEGDNPVLVFGSSELSPKKGNAFYPAQFWTNRNYGMNIQAEGRAYFTSLWDAIEVGAIDSSTGIVQGKLVIMPSFTWFLNATKYDNEKKQLSFSPSSYKAFDSNVDISSAVKSQVKNRLLEYGIAIPSDSGAVASLFDESISEGVSDVRLKVKTIQEPFILDERNFSNEGSHSQPIPESRFGGLLVPDWEKIQSDAHKRTADKSSNAYHFEDSWYNHGFKQWLGSTEKWMIDPEDYFNEREFEEFGWLLQICGECGIQPLVVIAPVNSIAWDLTAIDSSVRASYYDRIADMASRSGAIVADLSSLEDDPYFCRDYNHPSEYGWSLINEAIYNYYYN